MRKLNDISLIDRYLRKELSDSQNRLLEKRIESDSDFRNLLQDMEFFIEGIKESAARRTEEEKWEALAASSNHEIMSLQAEQVTRKPQIERRAHKKLEASTASFFRRMYERLTLFIVDTWSLLYDGKGKETWTLSPSGDSGKSLSVDVEKAADASIRRVILQVASIAATVLILFIALNPLFNGPGSHFEYAMNEYAPTVPKYWYTDRGSEKNELASIALDLDQGNYNQAAEALETVIRNPAVAPTDAEQFFLAFSYIKMENYAQAIPILELLRKTSQTKQWTERTDWLLALTYGANGQQDLARVVLHEIMLEEDHSFRIESQNLLEEIK